MGQKPYRLQTTVEGELYDRVEEATKTNGLSMAEITRNALWEFFKGQGGITLPDHEQTVNRRDQLKRENRPVLIRGDFRNKVWDHMKNQLDKDFSPEPDLFDKGLDSWRKEAEEYPEEKEFKTFCNFVSLIYRICHPEGGATTEALDDIFYLIEKGSVMGGDETARLVKDFLERNAGIPDQYLVRAWRAGTGMKVEDKQLRFGTMGDYYKDEDNDRLKSKGER